MDNISKTTKIIVGVVVALLIILGIYLDTRPAGSMMGTDMTATTTGPAMVGGQPTNGGKPTVGKNGTAPKAVVPNDGNSITTLTPNLKLTASDWVWKNTIFTNKAPTVVPSSERFVLSFGTDGHMKSATDCNSVAGSYSVRNGNALTFGSLASTMMACQGQTYEAEYVKELGQVESFSTSTTELKLNLAKNAGVMTFTVRKQ